jgi:hydrogenase-4 component H
MFKLLRKIAKTGDVTTAFPAVPFPISPNFRGSVKYDPKRCMACAACTIACPANALTMVTDPVAETRTWMLNYGRCVLCARCEEVCPTQAIRLTGEFELAVRTKADLMASAQFTLTRCRNCDKPFAPTKEVNYAMALLERAGINKEELERRRVLYETCTECRRKIDFAKLRKTALVSGLDASPAVLEANAWAAFGSSEVLR